MRPIVLVALLVALIAPALAAQTSPAGPLPPQTAIPPRWGLVAGTGFGIGMGEAACVQCQGKTAGGPAGYARLGGTYRENLVVAAQADWWTGSSRVPTSVTTTIWNTSLVVQWYPHPSRGLHVIGGVGVGFLSTDTMGGLVDGNTTAHGLGYQLGLGYDVPIAQPHVTEPVPLLLRHVWRDIVRYASDDEGAHSADRTRTHVEVNGCVRIRR